MTRYAHIAPMLLSLSVLASCVPTAARKNATVESGVDLDFSAGVQLVGEGEEDANGQTNAPTELVHFEADLQYGHSFEDSSGFAVQLKLPLNIVFVSLDLYYQLPSAVKDWSYGFGVEIGALRGLYGVLTHKLGKEFYLSATPRLLLTESLTSKHVLVNPQISMGIDTGEVDASAFFSAAYHTGRGFDFDIDLFSDNNNTDYRKQFFLVGVSIRL